MTTATNRESLQIRRTIRAPRQRVFDAFVKPELRKLWWFPEEGMVCDRCEIDPRIGGSYSVNMKHGQGEQLKEWSCTGEFVEVDEPTRLVFSWVWDHARESATDLEQVTSVVTVDLRDVDGGTEVSIRHDRLIDAQDAAGHLEGWEGCLASLARALERD